MKLHSLFRAKNKLTKKRMYGDLVWLKDGKKLVPHIYSKGEADPETISIFTGKTDRKGTPIYSKDICRFYGNEEETADYLIKWDEDKCRFISIWLFNGAEDDFDDYFAECCEVIDKS